MALEFRANEAYPDLYWHGERLVCIGRGAYKRVFSLPRLDIVVKLGFTDHVNRDLESLCIATRYFDVAPPKDVWTFVDFERSLRYSAFIQQKLSIGVHSLKIASEWNYRYRRGDYGIETSIGDLKDTNIGVDGRGKILVHDCELLDKEAPTPLWYQFFGRPPLSLNGCLTVSEMAEAGWELVGGADD